ncbi:MAG: glycosyltransferase involved in cell wall biosynthesis [Alteromonadaceae bacterium]|jgi:glycosyltransferase involved in cell wall biosynthesis
MLKVLAIGYVWPEPNSSAAGTYMLSLLKTFLAEGWQVTFATPAARSDHMVDLAELGINSAAIELNNTSFDRYITDLRPDIVLFDRFMMEEQFGWRVEKHCPDALRLLDTEDLHFLRQARHRAYKQNREVTVEDLHSDMAKREIAAILRCDLSLIISQTEVELLKNQYSVDSSLLLHLPFMLKLTEKPPPGYEQRQDFISIGNFRHAPNWDAVLWLQQSVWPLIKKQLPNAQLNIYGAYPPPKATALNAPKKGFNVLGWAKDANQVMQQARVCLAPLRFGAGIKGKLADAMLNGTPNVTTPVGAEAMANGLDWSGFIESSAQGVADKAVLLYQDSLLWKDSQQKGFAIIKANYDKTRLGEQLIKAVNYQREHLQTIRNNNFTGAMLRHHSHKSTQYMAQWIEAKNK